MVINTSDARVLAERAIGAGLEAAAGRRAAGWSRHPLHDRCRTATEFELFQAAPGGGGE